MIPVVSDVIKEVAKLLVSQVKDWVKAREKREALEQSFTVILAPVENEPFYADIEKLIASGTLQTQLMQYCADVPLNGPSIVKRCNDIAATCSTDIPHKSQLYSTIYKLSFSIFYMINEPSSADIKAVMNNNNQNTAALREEIQQLAAMLADLIKAFREANRQKEDPPLPAPTFVNPPYPKNESFVCRESLLDTLQQNFATDSQTQYLCGRSGVGKTQIALAYAFRHKADYDRIVWIHAESKTSVLDSYLEFIQNMHLPGAEQETLKPDQILRSVFRWMETVQNWLFIFDNLEELPNDCAWWPRCTHGHLLITTQKNRLQTGKRIPVSMFSPEEAVAFLEKRTERQDPEPMAALAKQFGYLPLALEQAAAYILNNPGISFTGYLALLDSHGLAVFDDNEGVIDYDRTVTATMELAMQRIGSEAANQLLNLCAYLAPDNITQSLFRENAKALPEPLQTQLADPLAANKVWRELSRYSLLETRDDEQGYAIHRLLQEVVRRKIDGDPQWARCWLAVFGNVFNFKYGDPDSHARFKQLFPHVEAFLQAANSLLLDDEEQIQMARLYAKGGFGQFYLGNYTQALEWYCKALPIRESVLGKNHPDTASTYNNIALVYNHLGDYPKALDWYFKALPVRESVLRKNHPDTATTYNNIALVYDNLGDYPKALEWHFKALPICESVLGKNHPDTAVTYNNIASVYDNLGDYQKALEWYGKALPIRESVLGKNHPSTATTYNNIASVYDNLGDYPKALDWFFKALPIRESILGENHPDTAATYNNIALVYNHLGDYPTALDWYFKALHIRESVLGKNHPSTAVTYNNIASVYYHMDEKKKALEWLQKAHAIFKKTLGEAHPYTKIVEEGIRTLTE